MTSDTQTPDVRSLVAGQLTTSDGARLRQQNQEAAERAGHLQNVPMTMEGLAQLRLLKDVLNRHMSEKGIAPSLREGVLSASAELSLQGQQTRLDIAIARPLIQQVLMQRRQEQEQELLHPGGG